MSLPPKQVDLASPVPYYAQICELLRDRILAGEWTLGSRIPTETELCEAYEVSRITVRQALALLVRDGLLVRARGRGTFVHEPHLTAAPRSVSSFSDELTTLGLKPGSRILQSAAVSAASDEAAEMKVDIGTELFSLRRLRTADGRPIGVQNALVVAARFPGLLDLLGHDMSLYEIMRRHYGIVATGATEVFRAAGIGHDDARLLECKIGTPGFHVTRVSFDDRGVFERTSSVLHGDRYQIRIALQKTRPRKGTP